MLACGALEGFGVVKITEDDGLDAFGLEHLGLILSPDNY